MSDLERKIAQYEAARNNAVDRYFDARPNLERNRESERLVENGFRLAWELVDGEVDDLKSQLDHARSVLAENGLFVGRLTLSEEDAEKSQSFINQALKARIVDNFNEALDSVEWQINWEKAPDWANYHAVDYDGRGHWYEARPIPSAMSKGWYYHPSADGQMTPSGFCFGELEKWNASLRERPAKAAEPVEAVAEPIPTEGDVPVNGRFLRPDGSEWMRISDYEVVKILHGRPIGAVMPLFPGFPVGVILESTLDLHFPPNADVSEGGDQ